MIARKKAKAAAEKAAKEAAERGAAGAATGGAGAASGGAAGGISVLGPSSASGAKVAATAAVVTASADLPRLRNADLAELDIGKNAKVEFPEGSSKVMHLRVTIEPTGGLWKGGKYEFDVNFKKSYPHDPPKVTLATPCYHPNLDKDGGVCINILRKDWKPVLDLNSVIYGMVLLFEEPNPMDPLDIKAAELMRKDKASFERNVEASMRGRSIDGRTFPRFK